MNLPYFTPKMNNITTMKYFITLLFIGFYTFSIAQRADSVSDLELSSAQLGSYDLNSSDINVAYMITDAQNQENINRLNAKLREDAARAALSRIDGKLRFFSYGPNKETICNCSADKTEKLIYYLKTDGEYNCKVIK